MHEPAITMSVILHTLLLDVIRRETPTLSSKFPDLDRKIFGKIVIYPGLPNQNRNVAILYCYHLGDFQVKSNLPTPMLDDHFCKSTQAKSKGG